ncbi:hypothetical protein [Azospirillum picis]|uniref:DNA gyrase inhibitor YacG n=1 Tax=Azospirillum picis TaxID=488438 RepID=A0ABU0MKG3_9PROT|nr:hypothetical protein [Azospirillum picis]MBP2299923.1 hypothetical protein [Azospirillum picis]MDQ0533839.1 hypothetical protein [Azospirillum picis]
MTTLYCACCGRPFVRPSTRGPAPRYCSQDCRVQMAVRRRAWAARAAPQAIAGRLEADRAAPALSGWAIPDRASTKAGGRRIFAP